MKTLSTIALIPIVLMLGCAANQPKTNSNEGAAPVKLPAPNPEVVKMLNDLESNDEAVYVPAGQKIWMYANYGEGDKSLIPQMLRILNSGDEKKYTILGVFYEMGPKAKEALPDIKRCLTHHDKLVRSLAEEAIRAIEHPEQKEIVPGDPVPPAVEEIAGRNNSIRPESQPKTDGNEGQKK